MAKTRELRTDGEATRTRILEAAGELVAAAGFAGTPSKAIAERAGVDLASINYHFGSRAGLYQALLVEAHRRLVALADLQQFAESPLTSGEKLKVFIDYLVKNTASGAEGWHLSVLTAEVLSPSPQLEALFQNEVKGKISVVMGMLSEITAIPANDPALLRCLLSVVAPCLLLQIGRRGVPGPIREVLKMPHETVVEHLHSFAMAGLEAIGKEHVNSSGGRKKTSKARKGTV